MRHSPEYLEYLDEYHSRYDDIQERYGSSTIPLDDSCDSHEQEKQYEAELLASLPIGAHSVLPEPVTDDELLF